VKNYLTYPTKTMRITQSYNGSTSHIYNSSGTPCDYPIDEGEKDAGRGNFYCCCNELIIKRIYGTGGSGTNTIWFETTSKVITPSFEDYVAIMVIHPNDDDLIKLKVGHKFKRGDYIMREGKDGATGYHFHISVGRGKFKGNGWQKNNKGKYVINTTGQAIKPENAFYIDDTFTKIKDSKGLKFNEIPKEVQKPIIEEPKQEVEDPKIDEVIKEPTIDETPIEKPNFLVELFKLIIKVLKEIFGGK